METRAWRFVIADQRVTLRDIAEASGASLGTVSMALNQRDGVSTSTRRRIKEIAESLGYERSVPRRTAASIVSVVVERLPISPTSDPFNRPILLSLESAARRAGYRIALEFADSEREPDTEHWTSNSTAGIIILGGGDLGSSWVTAASESGLPMVMVDHFIPGMGLPCVVPDNICGAYLATRHLLETGHERIGFIRGPSKYWTLSERMAGFLLAMRQSNLKVSEDLIPPRVSHGAEKGYGEMRHLLDLTTPPTAVFAVSDKTAIGAYRAIQDRGLSIPHDISIVGYDNIEESGALNPPLTTVEVEGDALGSMAFYRLLDLLDNGESGSGKALKWTLPTRLIERDSVAAPQV